MSYPRPGFPSLMMPLIHFHLVDRPAFGRVAEVYPGRGFSKRTDSAASSCPQWYYVWGNPGSQMDGVQPSL